jgi:phage-related protein
MRFFETRFLEEADEFISQLDSKTIKKIFYNIDLAELQIRLLAFWDKTDKKETLVIATHGFIKKVDKVPAHDITRAVRLRDKYFNNKINK